MKPRGSCNPVRRPYRGFFLRPLEESGLLQKHPFLSRYVGGENVMSHYRRNSLTRISSLNVILLGVLFGEMTASLLCLSAPPPLPHLS